jgi:RNA-directed DNA polymerase
MDDFAFIKATEKSISNLANLAGALQISEELLHEALSLPQDQRYTPHRPKGGNRLVYRPHSLIRKIQRKIKTRILVDLVKYPKYLYGSISDKNFPRDYIRCAQIHCLRKSVLKIDITKFFDNIGADVVEDIYADFFCFPHEVVAALENLCTYEGKVPQGAPTSSHLANLCFFKEEPRLVRQLDRLGLKYTRLVDDITISSSTADFDFEGVQKKIRHMVDGKGLVINEDKTGEHFQGSTHIKVHGLRINFPEPQMPRDEVRNIRAAVHELEERASQPNARVSLPYRRLYESTSGRVNKLKRLKHSMYERYRKRLKQIRPLPSKKDLARCVGLFNSIVSDEASAKDTYWYYSRYYRLQNRLNLVQLKFRSQADRMREILKNIKPTYRNYA